MKERYDILKENAKRYKDGFGLDNTELLRIISSSLVTIRQILEEKKWDEQWSSSNSVPAVNLGVSTSEESSYSVKHSGLEPKSQDVLFLIGPVGAGKSTLSQYLARKKVMVRYDEVEGKQMYVEDNDNIRHDHVSGYTNFVSADGFLIVDLAGIRDTGGLFVELLNAVERKKIAGGVKDGKCKVLVCYEYGGVTLERGASFVSDLATTFANQGSAAVDFSLIVSKFDRQDPMQRIINLIKPHIHDKEQNLNKLISGMIEDSSRMALFVKSDHTVSALANAPLSYDEPEKQFSDILSVISKTPLVDLWQFLHRTMIDPNKLARFISDVMSLSDFLLTGTFCEIDTYILDSAKKCQKEIWLTAGKCLKDSLSRQYTTLDSKALLGVQNDALDSAIKKHKEYIADVEILSQADSRFDITVDFARPCKEIISKYDHFLRKLPQELPVVQNGVV